MNDFVYNKALGYEFDVQFLKLIKYSKLIFNHPSVTLGKENLERLEKFFNPYEKTKTTHFENCTKFYMEVFYNFYNENKSFFTNDISFQTRKSWILNEDVQVLIKGDKSNKILSMSTIYRTALHVSELCSNPSDETVLYPLVVLLHFFRILKLVIPNEHKEEKEVITNDIKLISQELGLEKNTNSASSSSLKNPMNFADIFNAKNIGMIESAIKAITTNDKFNNIMQNISSKDNDDISLNPTELTSGVLEIMNAMKSEIPSILNSFNNKDEN